MAYSSSETDHNKTEDGLLDVGDLCRMFEESEEATLDARKEAERDRDYVDNKQHTAEEIAILEKRGQPLVTDNRIKPKIDFLVGLEKEQRIDPKALPRTPRHEEDADGATQALRYTCDVNGWDAKRSGVWRNMLVEGAGGIRVYAEPSRKSYGGGYGQQAMMATTALTQGQQQYDIKISRVSWDRMFWDPHSSECDFCDAGYLGIVVWMDYSEACIKYPDGKDALDTTMASVSHTDTYDDKPKFTHWADKKRKRVRICQIWIKRDEEWHFAEFTKGGILKAGPSPYKTDTGESDCELFFQSAFVDRDNNRYGYVREMISPQDEVNKRRSKTLHALNTKQIFALQGAVNDVEKARTQVARPDGWIEVNQIVQGPIESQLHVVSNTEMTEGNFKLLVEAQNAIDLKGPNATMLGDKAQGSASASGKAIIASQQGGRVSLGDLSDNLKDLDLRVFRALWNRIRQFWTAEKWLRTTDDERNVKWVALNVQRPYIEMMMQQNPQAAEKIAGSVGNVAELDCDIIIDEGPDSLTPQLEQFQALVELKKMDQMGEIPFRAIVEAIPNLKNRQRFLEAMDQAEQQRAEQGQPPDPEMVKAQTQARIAQMQQAEDAKRAANQQQIDAMLAERKQSNDAALQAQKAESDMAIAEYKAENEIRIKREQALADEQIRHRQADTDEKIATRKADSDERIADRKLEQEAAAKGEVPAKHVRSDLKAISVGLEKQTAALVEVIQELKADTEVVRDDKGKVVGSRKVRR